MPIIELKNITKTYQGKVVLDKISLALSRGAFYTLIGSSGAGKTTLLRLINGLVKPDSGAIFMDGKDIAKSDLIELRRNIGYVIQSIGLFPHMTIYDNINYVPSLSKEGKALRRERVQELIRLVGMQETDLLKYPSQLSGGQKQRVGVARALAGNPDIVLMDEPFGAVDDITRHHLQDEILAIHEKLGNTIIFVTHDIEEAIKLGTRIIILNEGKIEQIGTKNDIIFFPKNDFVREFLGDKNYIAYLTTTKIGDVCDPVMETLSCYPVIASEKPIIEGLRRILNGETDILAVSDKDGRIIGRYDLSCDKHLRNSSSKKG